MEGVNERSEPGEEREPRDPEMVAVGLGRTRGLRLFSSKKNIDEPKGKQY